jgi:hypothetical protein
LRQSTGVSRTCASSASGYAPDRLRLVGAIMARLEDRADGQLHRLISKPRALIDAIAADAPHTWRQVLAIIRRKGASRRFISS